MGRLLALLAQTAEVAEASEKTDILFPGLGINLRNVGDSFYVFGFRIAYYGVTIGIAMVLGYLLADLVAKKTGQNRELYLDFTNIAGVLLGRGAPVF